jgi:D-alanine transaminase
MPASRTVYVNGSFCDESEAKISIFDRGVLFADAVYEVVCVLDGKLVDFDGHMARLKRSMGELDITDRFGEGELLAIHRELVARNGIMEGLVYLQVSRGAADRDFIFPAPSTPAGVFLFTQTKALLEDPVAERGIRVVTAPDLRWRRRDIKTTQLLYPSLAKTRAKAAGADDCWMVEDGLVTEASSANAFIVKDSTIVTRPTSNDILHGITRRAVLDIVRSSDLTLEERPFGVDEAKAASEAFITSASSFVMPVISIDGQSIGAGAVGPVARDLRAAYIRIARSEAR